MIDRWYRITQRLQREWKFILMLFMVLIFYGYSCYEYNKSRSGPMRTISQLSNVELNEQQYRIILVKHIE
jgi:cbb3-type cytochrome oxidase subunit 3